MKTNITVLLLLTSLFYCNFASAEKIWEDKNIRLASGKTIWARVDKEDRCYNLLLGGSGMNGTAKTCGGSLNGYWLVSACNKGTVTVDGGINKVINNIVNRCE